MVLRDFPSYGKNGNEPEVEPSGMCTFLAYSKMTKENCPFPFEAKNNTSAGLQ